jgi:hypothetical protein
MRTPRQILLGDLLRAWHRLQPLDDQVRQMIAALLGLGWRPPTVALQLDATQEEENVSEALQTREAHDDEDIPDAPSVTESPPRPPRHEPRPVPFSLEQVVEAQPHPPDWARTAAMLPPAGPPTHSPAPAPLFLPRWTPGILSAVFATGSRDGPIDLERTVRALASGQPLVDIPRSPRPTLRNGVQLLVDVGDAMAPFARDLPQLEGAVRRILSADTVERLRFAGCPLRGAGGRARASWRDYRAPRAGTPVVLVTDLGAGRPPLSAEPADPAEWLEFVEVVRRAACPLVAIVPYPRARIPMVLRRAIKVVEWDRTTTAATARRVVGRVLEPLR